LNFGEQPIEVSLKLRCRSTAEQIAAANLDNEHALLRQVVELINGGLVRGSSQWMVGDHHRCNFMPDVSTTECRPHRSIPAFSESSVTTIRSWLEVKTQVGWYEANSKHTVRSAAKQRVGHLRVGENSGFEISFVSTSDSADAEVILAGFL
jgi:hypothetical protein